ncbi:MAG: hypothetical protein OEY18_09650, partial [Candidatus Aminicenantes bacterium]|nr:hypothetical protein [Candidatus Aminicenantes bacterium]
MSKCFEKNNKVLKILFTLLAWASIFSFALTQEKPEEYEKVESSACVECHEKGKHDTVIKDDLSHSIHEGLECLDCHSDKDTV